MHNRDIFSNSFKERMLCILIRIVSSRRFWRVHTIYHFQYKKRKLSRICSNVFFQGTQERVQNSRGKRGINVWATESLLYTEYEYNMSQG